MKWLPLNFELLRNPYNWLVVGLMVAILGLAMHLIFGDFGTHDGNQATTEGAGDTGYSNLS